MMRFVRRRGVQVVVAVMLVAMLSAAVIVWMPYQRELNIARQIQAMRGTSVITAVNWQYAGPNWVPKWLRDRITVGDRISRIDLLSATVPPELLMQLETCHNLQGLTLLHSDVGDASIEILSRLKSLDWLDLRRTQITPEGRALLRKGLPTCKITPDP